MNHLKTLREADLEKLGRLKDFSWLTRPDLKVLSASLAVSNHKRGEVIFRESALTNEPRVLLAGIVRIIGVNADDEPVSVALIAPGLIPELPSPLTRGLAFWCESYNDCRIGTLDWKGFERVTLNGRESLFRIFHQNDLKHWRRLLLRTSRLFFDLRGRVAITMLDLCDDFGIEDSRGTLLSVSISQKDIASLVGASRPRVTEHLGQMERDQVLIRQGRQFIVNTAKLLSSLSVVAAERTPLQRPNRSDGMDEAVSKVS